MQHRDHHIRTARLSLVPLLAAHLDAFMMIAGDWQVARMTADIPHPLTLANAQQWFQIEANETRFAIELDSKMIGAIGYFTAPFPSASAPPVNEQPVPEPAEHEPAGHEARPTMPSQSDYYSAELGFFIARPHWGQGFASEAARAVLAHGFARGPTDNPDQWNLTAATPRPSVSQFTSAHFTDNPASARVLQKLGFTPGQTRQVYCQARDTALQAQCYSLSRDAARCAIKNNGAKRPAPRTASEPGPNQPTRRDLL